MEEEIQDGGKLDEETLYFFRGTKRLVSVNICSVECYSAGIFDSKLSPGIFLVKKKLMPIIFGRVKLPFWAR